MFSQLGSSLVRYNISLSLYPSIPLSLYPSIYLSLPPFICSNQGHVVRIRIASYVVWIWAEAKQGFGTNSVVIVGDTDTTHGYI